jgi:hypothetical protein
LKVSARLQLLEPPRCLIPLKRSFDRPKRDRIKPLYITSKSFCEAPERKERPNFPGFLDRKANTWSLKLGMFPTLFLGRCYSVFGQLLICAVTDPCLLSHGLSTDTVLAGFANSTLGNRNRLSTYHTFLHDFSHTPYSTQKKLIVKPGKSRLLSLRTQNHRTA